jgi:benzylsuccinate CoA-transferase BbsF subunit
MNAGKLGMTLDLGTEDGRSVFRDLVQWADVVCESYSPRAMRAWGLDYESLRAVKPDLIMLSSTLFGQSGPLSGLAGFGTMGAAVAGFNSITGWPDRAPAMVAAYSDYVAPRFTIAALMAALDHRDRTGEGQYIDLSQSEAAAHFLTPAVLDYSVNGRVAGPIGNADPQMSPHGVYPAAGDDRWVAIAARGDADWAALVDVIGDAALASDGRFATLEGRLGNREALDEAIGGWTATLDEGEIEATLQARDVPAHVVQNSPECARDPQLLHRGHFVELDHEAIGRTVVEGSRFTLSRTPARIERAAPTFGQDNMHVLTELLGYDGEQVAEVAAAEVLA